MTGESTIRAAEPADAGALAAIYNHYVLHTAVTFEEVPVSDEEMAERVLGIQEARLPWLVLESGGAVVGFAYASPWKGRCAYRFSVEVTVYVADGQGSRGFGSALYTALFGQLQARGLHTALAGIALPNPASIALHERFGMHQVAHFREVGFKFGQWVDVGYWQGGL